MDSTNTFLLGDCPVIKYGHKYVVYSPYKDLIAECDINPKDSEELRQQLSSAGFFDNGDVFTPKDGFTSLALFLSSSCNLQCKYCYAHGGPSHEGNMSFELARTSIDLYLQNSPAASIRLTYHGGGEPTLEFGMIKKIDNYLQTLGVTSRALITTNGTAPLSVYEWMIEHDFSITFSFDGIPLVQDFQRPYHNGKPSSSRVESTIISLANKGYPIMVRPTITKLALDHIEETMTYFANIGVNHILFEPLYQAGRAIGNLEVIPPTMEELVEALPLVFDLARSKGLTVGRSCYRFMRDKRQYHCGAFSGSCMAVTPQGEITSCFEITGKESELSGELLIGKIDMKNNQLILDHKKIAYLRERNSEKLLECSSCFAKHICAGGCGVRALRSNGTINSVDNFECEFSKRTLEHLIYRIWQNSQNNK